MPPINDSKDLLYVVISLCVLLLTFFSCWAIYYMARILGQMFKMIKEVSDLFKKIDELMKVLKEKIDHSASYLYLIGEGVKKLVELMKDRGEKKRKTKKAE